MTNQVLQVHQVNQEKDEEPRKPRRVRRVRNAGNPRKNKHKVVQNKVQDHKATICSGDFKMEQLDLDQVKCGYSRCRKILKLSKTDKKNIEMVKQFGCGVYVKYCRKHNRDEYHGKIDNIFIRQDRSVITHG